MVLGTHPYEPSAIQASHETRNGDGCWEAGARHAARDSEQYSQAGGAEIRAMQYAIVIEKSATGYGAYVPDLPGCIAVGESEEEVRDLIGEAIEFHLDGMREDGIPIPSPSSRVEYINIPNAA